MSRQIAADATSPGVVVRYMTRPPLSRDRMLGEASNAQVIYRSDAVHPRHQGNFRVFNPLDFLAEVSAHIPDPHEKTTLFYGWYSNRTRGYRKQHALLANAEVPDPVPGTDHRARLIRQVDEVDPLLCPQCGGTMKVIALIDRPAIIRQIRSAELATKPRAPGALHRSAQLSRATRPAP